MEKVTSYDYGEKHLFCTSLKLGLDGSFPFKVFLYKEYSWIRSSMSDTEFSDLPDEMLMEIVSHLIDTHPDHALIFCAVSQRFRHVCQQHNIREKMINYWTNYIDELKAEYTHKLIEGSDLYEPESSFDDLMEEHQDEVMADMMNSGQVPAMPEWLALEVGLL